MNRRILINQNQLSLPFDKSKIGGISHENRVRFFWMLVGISIFALFTYVYAINATARNIALRQDLERKILNISGNIDSLEFQYIALKNNITMELAYQYGFKEVRNPLYVSRTVPDTLSFNTIKQ